MNERTHELPFDDSDGPPPIQLREIVSGGQSGVDRAALDAAITCHLPHAGWCPAGQRAEDGPIDPRYQLRETPRSEYPQRTEWNIRDSDGTLLLFRKQIQGGTRLTRRLAHLHGRPCLVSEIEPTLPARFVGWLGANQIRRLNVAGPRESTCPGIFDETRSFLIEVFSSLP